MTQDYSYTVEWADGEGSGRSAGFLDIADVNEQLRLVETSDVVYTREHPEETMVKIYADQPSGGVRWVVTHSVESWRQAISMADEVIATVERAAVAARIARLNFGANTPDVADLQYEHGYKTGADDMMVACYAECAGLDVDAADIEIQDAAVRQIDAPYTQRDDVAADTI